MCSLIFHFERSLFEVAGRLWLVWVWRLDLSEIWKLPLLKFKDALLQNEPSVWQKLGPERILVPGLHWRARQVQLMTSSRSTEWWPWAGEAPKEARIVFLVFSLIQRFFKKLGLQNELVSTLSKVSCWSFHLFTSTWFESKSAHIAITRRGETVPMLIVPPRFLWSRFSFFGF